MLGMDDNHGINDIHHHHRQQEQQQSYPRRGDTPSEDEDEGRRSPAPWPLPAAAASKKETFCRDNVDISPAFERDRRGPCRCWYFLKRGGMSISRLRLMPLVACEMLPRLVAALPRPSSTSSTVTDDDDKVYPYQRHGLLIFRL